VVRIRNSTKCKASRRRQKVGVSGVRESLIRGKQSHKRISTKKRSEGGRYQKKGGSLGAKRDYRQGIKRE